MKLKRVEIHNFKCVKHLELSFERHGTEPRFLTCLVGDNGSGKTTVLQAIALVLSLATGKTESVNSFSWYGFEPERLSTHGETRIDLSLVLDSEEITAWKNVREKWDKTQPSTLSLPSDSQLPHSLEVDLSYQDGNIFFFHWGASAPVGLGRRYLRMLRRRDAGLWDYTKSLGDVFWFDQVRLLGTGLFLSESLEDREEVGPPFRGGGGRSRAPSPWESMRSIRESLVGWWTYHKSERKKERDLIADLEPRLQEIFPGTRFVGVEPKPGLVSPSQKDFFLLLERGESTYDISEMSSGEQAVFEILYEFVRLQIARSVVLIDEIELHLHPPQQQALLAALPKLGPECQFIITTHSPYVEDVLPEEEIVRMEGPTHDD
jgi:predicted ATPase